MKKPVKKLPIIGYFSETKRKFKHEVPVMPDLALDSMLCDLCRTEPSRPLKSRAVEALDRVKNRDGHLWGGTPEVSHWLEAGGYVEPVEFKKDSPYSGDVIYRITAKGEEFLRQHEAPVCWA